MYSFGECVAFLFLIISVSSYCKPTEDCWPTQEEWDQFSADLTDGVLKIIEPVDVVYAECSDGFNQGVGGTILPQYANGTCSFGISCVYEECEVGQDGYLPNYSVEATAPEHVQKTVQFASQHNIRLSVKATGADYSMANQQTDSILIWMSNYIKHTEEGVKEDFVDTCGDQNEAVIKVGGGEPFGLVFKALVADGRYMLSSGAAVTVGGAGGWLQGGGLGPFDRELGLGVDNVLQFEVVTADGSIKTVDACSEPDLFWALRGGGGGNWGVVLSQISKVHPIKPLVRMYIIWAGAAAIGGATAGAPVGTPIPFANKFNNDVPITWTKTDVAGDDSSPTIKLWHNLMLDVLNPATMANKIDGYYGMGCTWLGFVCADLYFRGTMEEFKADYMPQIQSHLEITNIEELGGSGEAYLYVMNEYSSYYDYASSDCKSATAGSPEDFICNTLGYPSANGYNADAQMGQGGYRTRVSWVVPESLFLEDKRDLMNQWLAEPLTMYLVGHVIGGYMNEIATDATAVNPVMRKSAYEILFVPEMGESAIKDMINKYFPPEESSPVFNHDGLNLDVLNALSEQHNTNWQGLYWGSNLERLQSIKATYDSNKLFQCRDCVTAAAEIYDNCLEYPTEEQQIQCLKEEVLALESQLADVTTQYEQVLVEEAAAEQTCEQAKADIESALGSCSSD